MTKLKLKEQESLEKLFGMGNGCADVLFPTVKHMVAFFDEEFGVNISDGKYSLPNSSGSRASRIRGYWAAEPDYRVGELLFAFLRLRSENRAGRPEDEHELVTRCEVIAKRLMAGRSVEIAPDKVLDPLSHEYINEQVDKCKAKMGTGDHSGAITNARTMVETVLLALEQVLFGEQEDHRGDMQRMYRRVAGRLKLDSGQPDLTTPLRQVLTGLFSIVAGLSAVRNSASDAHGRLTRTREHHARVAVNAAMTLTDFLLSTYEYQKAREAASPSENPGEP